MSFANFLVRVTKMGVGYLGGFAMFFVGIMLFAQGDTTFGTIFSIIGVVLALYGVYMENGGGHR